MVQFSLGLTDSEKASFFLRVETIDIYDLFITTLI